MTKATTAGQVGDVEQFRAQHPEQGLNAVAAEAADTSNARMTEPATDEADITSPGWDAPGNSTTKESSAKLLEQAESYVVANPLKSIAAGFAAGVVISRML